MVLVVCVACNITVLCHGCSVVVVFFRCFWDGGVGLKAANQRLCPFFFFIGRGLEGWVEFNRADQRVCVFAFVWGRGAGLGWVGLSR